MANSAMLSAFSMGRVTCLVIDIGASGTKITPIVEGYELKRSSVYTTRGGNTLDDMLLQEIQARTGAPIKPWFECNEKLRAQCPQVTPSYHSMHVRDVVHDVKQWMCFVPHNPIVCPSEITDPMAVSRFREEELGRRSLQFPPPYELPDGTQVSSGDGVCTVPERLFFATLQSDPVTSRKRTRDLLENTFAADFSTAPATATMAGSSQQHPEAMQVCDANNTAHLDTVFSNTQSNSCSSSSSSGGTTIYPSDGSLMGKLQHQHRNRAETESLTDLVYAAVAHADVDVRKELLANIHVAGGGSLISGLPQRLSYELNNVVPMHLKVKGIFNFVPPFSF